MAVSYVLVTAAAVVLVEGVVLGILLPRILASSGRASQAATVAGRAGSEAKLLSELAGHIVALSPKVTSEGLVRELARSPKLTDLGLARPGHTVPRPGRQCLPRANVEALVSVKGAVLASSSPGLCPVGAQLGFATQPGMSAQGTRATSRGDILWAVSPVYAPGKGAPGPTPGPSPAVTPSVSPAPVGSATAGQGASPAVTQSGSPAPVGSTTAGKGASGKGVPPGPYQVLPGQVLGGVYAGAPAHPAGVSFAQVRPLLITGSVVLALVIPVGTVFGLLSTRRVIHRIKRLAEVTGTVAAGDFRPRVPVSGGDEIGRLEDAFNRMTGRLSAAVDAERVRAGTDARQSERARIARELHDSISQDLFSLSLLAAGLRRALHADPALRPEVVAMERTSARAMREMQALLLELRPVALEDAGLVPAVTELCQAYQTRLAIKVTAELGDVSLGPAAEHAVLRIVQEALGNAARHGEPETVLVRLSQRDGSVTVEVRDDGRGFDPGGVGERHGMGLTLMRERVTELGGDLQLEAAPGEGAVILVRLPAGQDGRP
jgi:signal transduction histidine kinase